MFLTTCDKLSNKKYCINGSLDTRNRRILKGEADLEYQQRHADLRGRIKNIVDEDDESFWERLNDMKHDDYFRTHFYTPMKDDISPNYFYGSMENDEFPRKINKVRYYDNFEKQDSSYQYCNNVPMKSQKLENKKNSKGFSTMKYDEGYNNLLHDRVRMYADLGVKHNYGNPQISNILKYDNKKKKKSQLNNFLKKMDLKLDIELSRFLKMTSKALFIGMTCMLAKGTIAAYIGTPSLAFLTALVFVIAVSMGWYYVMKLINIKYVCRKYSTDRKSLKKYEPKELDY
ncbi:Plasmodium exported protein, unknown function [Plasmodium ovale curtisi]|uniref:Pv-fam-d protein n=1 Tax=Plasmodium ovale curtisi TaxID=864141 RepID=A0A1A8X892_PLAOA|nr:Plasmodium exported protein, unknown function [Plasmodium ovale curtisi]SBT01453.1 Plasmodium exported protein, unknown function [Plasmodium ovale curtisi]